MTKGSGSKGGRPRRSEERLQRVNLSLRQSVIFGLELIARDRDISMSQAVEYVFNVVARDYALAGDTVRGIVSKATALEAPIPGSVWLDAHDGISHTPEEMLEIHLAFLRATGISRILFMPESLRTAEERYFAAMYESEGPGYWTEGELFASLAREGFEQGIPPEEMGAKWRRLAADKLSAGAGSKSPPSAKRTPRKR